MTAHSSKLVGAFVKAVFYHCVIGAADDVAGRRRGADPRTIRCCTLTLRWLIVLTLPRRYHRPLNWLPAYRLLLPRSGLKRSDFVHWPIASFRCRAISGPLSCESRHRAARGTRSIGRNWTRRRHGPLPAGYQGAHPRVHFEPWISPLRCSLPVSEVDHVAARLHHGAGWPLSSLAQQPHKVPRIAFLTTASPPGSQYTHAFIRGLADLGRAKVTTLPLSGDGPWLNGTVPPVRSRSRGFERGCHRGREQSSGLGRQERPRQFPLSLRRWRTRCNKDSPRASLIREAASRGSTSRRRLAAHRPAFRVKIACNVVAACSFPGTRSKQSFRIFAAN